MEYNPIFIKIKYIDFPIKYFEKFWRCIKKRKRKIKHVRKLKF